MRVDPDATPPAAAQHPVLILPAMECVSAATSSQACASINTASATFDAAVYQLPVMPAADAHKHTLQPLTSHSLLYSHFPVPHRHMVLKPGHNTLAELSEARPEARAEYTPSISISTAVRNGACAGPRLQLLNRVSDVQTTRRSRSVRSRRRPGSRRSMN